MAIATDRYLPTAPAPPTSDHSPPASSNPAPSGTGNGSSGASGGGGNPYLAAQRAAEKRANAKEAAAKHKAAQKWLRQAATMQQQINSLKVALGSKGYRRSLRIQLQNVALTERQTDRSTLKGYNELVTGLREQAANNEKTIATKSYEGLSNRGRERANALSEAALQGAGETDLLRAQGASLRNWNANQNTVTKDYHDVSSSINSSLDQLTQSTRQGRIQTATGANDQRTQLWTDYYGNRAEVLGQLGNAYGQQAEYYASAMEMDAKGVGKKQKRASHQSGAAFRRQGLTEGQAWRSPGVRSGIRNWEGVENIPARKSGPMLADAVNEEPAKKPEGATLRDWHE